jgi:hypothetical protein
MARAFRHSAGYSDNGLRTADPIELLRRVPVKYLAFCVYAVNDSLDPAYAD